MKSQPDGNLIVSPEVLEEIQGAIRIAISFTGESIFEEKLNLQDVIGIIAPLNRNEAIAVCAEWNRQNTWIMFRHGTWKPAYQLLQHVLDELVPPSAQLRAKWIIENEEFSSPISEVSVLGLIGLLCRYATVTGGDSVETRHGRRALFRALLALQGSIFPDNFLDLAVPEQFPFIVRVILANKSLQNLWSYDLGRLHAFLTVPDIRLADATVREWFGKRLNVDGNDYECVANTFHGSAFFGADYTKLRDQAPSLYRLMLPLLELSATTPEHVILGLDQTHPQPEPAQLSDALAYSCVLLVRPMICLGERFICTSNINLFNKFHRGLPYLCLEARTNPYEEQTRPRDEFGYIFEAYAVWLMKQWIADGAARLLTNYWIPCSEGSAERDILIIAGNTGYLFEVKSTVPAMKIRQFGSLKDLVALHKKAASQAFTAAEALIAGQAFEDRELTRRLPKLEKVVPCAITYEVLAVLWPYSEPFEGALMLAVNKPLFENQGGVLPLQILDIQQVEVWDDLFNLPNEIASLLQALEVRALNPMKRYRALLENSFRPDYAKNPGIVRKMTDRAEKFSRRRLKELS